MIKRTLSTVVLWAIVFAVVGLGRDRGGAWLLAVFALLAQYEFQGILEKAGLSCWHLASLALGFTLVLTPLFNEPCLMAFWIVSIFALAAGCLACAMDSGNLRKLAGSVLALAYVPGLMLFYPLILRDYGGLQMRGEGVWLAIWVIATAKFTDVGGYVVGSLIGRHKLAPSISPGKTWEGVAGGLAFAAAIAALTAKLGHEYLPMFLTPVTAAGLAVLIGIAAIASDLSESAFKRSADVKDSGRCIPGIGGALDLADSLLFAGPAAYFLFWGLFELIPSVATA